MRERDYFAVTRRKMHRGRRAVLVSRAKTRGKSERKENAGERECERERERAGECGNCGTAKNAEKSKKPGNRGEWRKIAGGWLKE